MKYLGLVLALSACGPAMMVTDSGSDAATDAGATDAGAIDAGTSDADAGALDAGALDAGALDAGALDAGASDAGATDAGLDCTPRLLDLDTPFSTTVPPFATRSGQQMPTTLWGSIPAPRPTNAAWENFVVGPGQNRVDFLPYQLKTVPEGLALGLGTPINTATSIDVPDLKQLVFSSAQPFSSRGLTAYDAFSVTVRWQAASGTMTAPMVFGMAYVTVDYAGLRPLVLPGTLTFTSINGATSPGAVTGTRFELTLSDGSRWLLYASGALTFDWTRTGMTARSALTGTLRVASLQRTADAALLDAHAEAIPRGGRLEVSVACDLATLRFVYATTGPGTLLMNARPHHLARLVLPALVPLEYPTLTGLLRGVEGSTWTMTLPLTTMQWAAPRPIDPALAPAVQAALTSETTTLPANVAADPYFGGKQLARLARFALIADELQDTATATRVRARLSALEGAWLSGTNANPLRFDTTWGGVVTTSSLTDPNADFGSGHYNDHHFHWGYHLYAAAVVGRADATFVTTHREALLALVRDIANPSAADPHFPRFRAMDFVRGHSWAAGLSEFSDGQNQESSSEAINAWYGMHLLGLAMNEPRVSDVGRVLLALELDAARTYYQMPSQSPLYGYPFKANRVVGILFQTRAFFGTFFAAGPQFVYGIQMLPFTPISESYLPRAWVQDAWPDMGAAAMAATQEWRGFLQMTHAIVDRPAAWTEVNALTAFDDGNSKTNALWWVATRP